ncbi:hypothetical protein [Cellulosimicrobium cellulans]|uniref:ATP-dependent DNA ligase n=1 Tax=Cellulosimicrobium cellulans TaxID=1710 RepID=UPI002406FDE7|nr:hypothetical protein [Cellulosimicrobium cellulans]
MSSGDDGARIWSRRGTDLTATFPEITTAVTEQIAPGVVLDGELVVWENGRLTFEALQERMGRGPRTAAAAARARPASLAAFDVLAIADRDVRLEPFDVRRALLVELASSWRPPLNLSPVTADVDEAREWFEAYAAVGVEGLVVKGGNATYRGGELSWLKVKHRSTVDRKGPSLAALRTAGNEVPIRHLSTTACLLPQVHHSVSIQTPAMKLARQGGKMVKQRSRFVAACAVFGAVLAFATPAMAIAEPNSTEGDRGPALSGEAPFAT